MFQVSFYPVCSSLIFVNEFQARISSYNEAATKERNDNGWVGTHKMPSSKWMFSRQNGKKKEEG